MPINPAGLTYVLGDLQGCAEELEDWLKQVQFRPRHDRLWVAGDLINRGPRSLAVLRRLIELEAEVVLGNHDLYFLRLQAWPELRQMRPADTFDELLAAKDLPDLIEWLRHRPLALSRGPYVMVHAGVWPQWDVDQLMANTAEVERQLRHRQWRSRILSLFGNSVLAPSAGLSRQQQREFTVSATTRMRYLHPQPLRLELKTSAPPPQTDLVPWFELEHHMSGHTLLCGHWASLGVHHRDGLWMLDAGCVWGLNLSGLCLETGELISVPSRQKAVAQGD